MRGIMEFVVLPAVVLGVVILWIWLFQERMVFFPEAPLAGTPADAGLAFEDLTLETPDGESLHAWYLPAEEDRATVLFCHGNAGNISQRLDTLGVLHGLGLNVLIFDYRGYGRSTGRPTESGVVADAWTAFRHLVEQRGQMPSRIVVMGRSLGSAVAVQLASVQAPAALIVESGFTSVPDLGRVAYPFLPRFLARIRLDSRSRIAEVRCPVLVAHSPDDEIVPFSMGRALFETAPEPKRFLTMRGDHNSGFMASGADYVTQLDAFLRELAGL